MKVIIYTYHFPRYSETFIARKFLYLLKKGVDVHVVAWPSNELDLFPEIHPYLNRVHYLYPVKNRLKAVFCLLFTLLKTFIKSPPLTIKYFRITLPIYGFKTTLKKFYSEFPLLYLKPDIIHFEYITVFKEHHHLKDILDFEAVASFRGHGVIYVGIEDKDYYTDIFPKIDAIHTIADYLVEYAEKYRGLSRTSINVIKKIPPAVPEELLKIKREYSNRDGINEPVRILTVGRLHWAKGYEYILKALVILKKRGLKFKYRIIGDGPLKEMIIYLIDLFNLEDNVKLLGKFPFRETMEHYQWADIFTIGTLWGSLKEGFSNAVLEAQALGLPVVAGEYHQNIRHVEEEAYAVPARRRDPIDFSNKLEFLIRNPHERKRIGIKAREFVKNNHTIEKQTEDFYELYKSLIGI